MLSLSIDKRKFGPVFDYRKCGVCQMFPGKMKVCPDFHGRWQSIHAPNPFFKRIVENYSGGLTVQRCHPYSRAVNMATKLATCYLEKLTAADVQKQLSRGFLQRQKHTPHCPENRQRHKSTLLFLTHISQRRWGVPLKNKHRVSHPGVTQPTAIAFLLWRHVTHLSICQHHRPSIV